jgi:hypothetical protein
MVKQNRPRPKECRIKTNRACSHLCENAAKWSPLNMRGLAGPAHANFDHVFLSALVLKVATKMKRVVVMMLLIMMNIVLYRSAVKRPILPIRTTPLRDHGRKEGVGAFSGSKNTKH